MVPETPAPAAIEKEKYRVLSRSPLTAVFLTGNMDRPEWAEAVFDVTDATVAKIKSVYHDITTNGWVAMHEDHRNVLVSLGYELGNMRNFSLFQKEIIDRVMALKWINPEELARQPQKTTPEGVITTCVTAGMVYKICLDLGKALANPEK